MATKQPKRIDLSQTPASKAAAMAEVQAQAADAVIDASFPASAATGRDLQIPGTAPAPGSITIEEIKIDPAEAYTPGRTRYYAFNTVQEHFTLIVPQLGDADEETTALGFSAVKDVVVYMSKEPINAKNYEHHKNAVKSGVNVMKKLALDQLNTTPFAEMAMQHGMSGTEADSFRPERLAELNEAQAAVTAQAAASNSHAMLGA